jgi:hypothetical protein
MRKLQSQDRSLRNLKKLYWCVTYLPSEASIIEH